MAVRHGFSPVPRSFSEARPKVHAPGAIILHATMLVVREQ